jgi:hypothetical protein
MYLNDEVVEGLIVGLKILIANLKAEEKPNVWEMIQPLNKE